MSVYDLLNSIWNSEFKRDSLFIFTIPWIMVRLLNTSHKNANDPRELAIWNRPFVWMTASEPIVLEVRASIKALNQWRRTTGRADMLLACHSLAEQGPCLLGPWGRVLYFYELTIKCMHAHPSSEWCSSFSQLLQCPWSSSTSVSFSSCGAVSFSSAILTRKWGSRPALSHPAKPLVDCRNGRRAL